MDNTNKRMLGYKGKGDWISTLGKMLKEPTHIQTHLVLADMQSPNKKTKEI